LSTIAIKIEGNEAKKYDEGELTTNLANNYADEQIDFKNGKFGFYDDDDNEWKYHDVYKIPLNNKTISIKTLESEEVFDNDGLYTYFKEHNLPTNITFTKGYIYCALLWDECWLDKDAMESLINNLQNK